MSKRVLDMTTVGELVLLVFVFAFMGIVAAYAPVTFVSQLLYFILAGFLGYFLIWNVEPALFSPADEHQQLVEWSSHSWRYLDG